MVLLLGVLFVLAPALARAQVADSLVLKWTAPSDPGAGAVSRYDLRWATSALTPASFASGTPIAAPTPGAPGALERTVVRGLTPGRSYWFAMRSVDASGNWSGLSNVVRWDGLVDASPPATPAALAATVPQSGRVTLEWSPGTEPDLAGYHVWRALDPASTWSSLGGVITDTSFVDPSLPEGVSKIWYAISAIDRAGNESARSAPLTVLLTSTNSSRPDAWHMLAAYPNPARTGEVVHVPVQVPAGRGDARLEIVDAANQVVRRFEIPPGVTGTTRVDWDGANDHGLAVAPGVYRAWLVSTDARQFLRIARVP